MQVSRRTYRIFLRFQFALPLACGTMILVSPLGDRWYAQVVAVMALIIAAIEAANFVRAWKETEPE